MFSEFDLQCMQRALELAARARGQTSPNPLVGAVVARGGRIVGEGYHKRAGQPHAEPLALRAAGKLARGATLYVTLEPCSTHGRTPPCTEAIRRAGIRRVVIATEDPNPKHHKRGIALLRRSGLQVQVGLLKDEAVRLNAAFNKWITTGLPLVTIKAALSLDGKIATRVGLSRWISGPPARAAAHRLRSEHDAILVGINTVLRDDPALTVRLPRFNRPQPWRLVLDSTGRIPLGCRLLSDRFRHCTIVVTTPRCGVSKREEIQGRGATVLVARRRGEDVDLADALRRLAEREITSLLVEGGGEAIASFVEQGLADRLVFFYAPLLIGGRDAVGAVGGRGVASPNDAPRVRNMSWEPVGNDMMLTAEL